MKKVLPIINNVPIKTYNYIAFRLSIIFGNYDLPTDWLFLNAFQLKYGPQFNDVTLDVYDDPEWNCFEKKILSNQIKTDEIIANISNNSYVYLAVDEKFIPNTIAHQQQSFIHDILVYGFNEEKKLFDIIGFDKRQQYICQKISFTELESAISSANKFLIGQTDTYEFFGTGNNFALKFFIPDSYKPIMDDSILKQEVEYFLQGDEFYSPPEKHWYSGIIVYQKILEDREALLDFRNWNIIKEHTQFILQYIESHFQNMKFPISESKKVIHYANLCLQLSLKYEIDNKENTVKRLWSTAQDMFKEIEKVFREILNQLITEQNQAG